METYEDFWGRLKTLLQRTKEMNEAYDQPYFQGVAWTAKSILLAMKGMEEGIKDE